MDNNIIIAFLLTLIAGIATGIGGLFVLFTKKTNTKFLAISLGFSAGVMIYVSFMEILQEANHSLTTILGLKIGSYVTVFSFFAGIILIALIDNLLPSEQNPHEVKKIENYDKQNHNLLRTGVFTALAIAIHNFPEGIATFISALNDITIAIPITVAIAIHNIPEGISVAIPIYYATNDKIKAFKMAFLSGLAEPIGALVGFLILRPFINDLVFGIVFGMIAGIMVFISIDELLPSAREYGEHHLSIYGLVFGMALMAFSLLIFI